MNTLVEFDRSLALKQMPKVVLLHSLRFRILAIVSGFVLALTVLFTVYTVKQFQGSTELGILHEGTLLS